MIWAYLCILAKLMNYIYQKAIVKNTDDDRKCLKLLNFSYAHNFAQGHCALVILLDFRTFVQETWTPNGASDVETNTIRVGVC
jgi:hypothetical protein